MRLFLVSLACLLWGCAGPATTHSSGHPSPRAASSGSSAGVEVVFTENEIRTIRAYYETHENSHSHGNGKSKAKGHGKSGDLPPGIARNLYRGKPLPPGLARRALPYELRRQLPPPPTGFERIVVAGKILLIETATQVVRDVLTDAMFG